MESDFTNAIGGCEVTAAATEVKFISRAANQMTNSLAEHAWIDILRIWIILCSFVFSCQFVALNDVGSTALIY